MLNLFRKPIITKDLPNYKHVDFRIWKYISKTMVAKQLSNNEDLRSAYINKFYLGVKSLSFQVYSVFWCLLVLHKQDSPYLPAISFQIN